MVICVFMKHIVLHNESFEFCFASFALVNIIHQGLRPYGFETYLNKDMREKFKCAFKRAEDLLYLFLCAFRCL